MRLSIAMLAAAAALSTPLGAVTTRDEPHPDAPPELAQLAPLVGDWSCRLERLQPDGTYQPDETVASWSFTYIMDGYALMDEWRSGGTTGINIRHYDPEAGHWTAKWLNTGRLAWETYEGRWADGSWTMQGAAVSPTGNAGHSRVTFSDMTDSGFAWRLDWSTDGGETWIERVVLIDCKRA